MAYMPKINQFDLKWHQKRLLMLNLLKLNGLLEEIRQAGKVEECQLKATIDCRR